MAAGAFLPPVLTRLTGDVGDLAAKVAEAKALIASLDGKTVVVQVRGFNSTTVARIAALKAALAGLDDKTIRVRTDMASAGATAVRMGGWFRLAGFGLRFLIMTAVEILATAIPALFAFGAAVSGMMATFIHIGDRMSFLRTATGDWRTALIDSVGPLHNIGMNMGILQRAMAPDAYIIFGSTINSLSGHFGLFSRVAQQAGKVLADFSVKLSNDLSGSTGQAISRFFSDSVRLMTQWGQVLGNIGRIFLNVVGAMWGSAKVFLFALDAITRALALLTNNKVVGWFVGLIFAFEAAARWIKFLGLAFTWLGNTAIVSAIKSVGTYMGALIALVGEEGVVVAATTVMGDLMDLALGPVGIAFAVVTAAVGFFILSTHKAADATDKLIAHVQKMPDNLVSLDKGFGMLVHGLDLSGLAFDKATSITRKYGKYAGGALLVAQQKATQDTGKLTKAIQSQAEKIVALRTGMAEIGFRTGAAGAAMKTLAIDTAITDSKVQQLNQGIDDYLSLIAGGTGNLYQFASAVKTFGHSMTQSTGAASGAWNNFSILMGQTAPKLMDWFRQARVLGAATGKSVVKAALDMAASMLKLAGSNKTAQAQVLAWARANGIGAGSLKQLQTDIKKQNAGQGDLKKKVDASTIALSKLTEMAKNASTALNSQVSTSIAQAALQASHFHEKLMQLARDESNHAPAATIAADTRAVRNALKQAQDQAVRTGNAISGSMRRSANAVAANRRQIEMLHAWIARLQSKNITIGVNIKQYGGITLPGGGGIRITSGYASGTQSAQRGWRKVGELGPELIHFNGGERVVPNHVSTGSQSPAGGGVVELHNHTYLDGKEIQKSVQRHTLKNNVRNNNRTSSGKVRGVLVPS
jgi:hypothetical protein